MESITSEVLRFQEGRADEATVVDHVSQLVYGYPKGRHGFSEEDGAEFLLRFYGRIRRLVKSYRDCGSSFESYLNTALRYQLHSFARRRASEKIVLLAATDRNVFSDLSGCGVEADAADEVGEPIGAGRLGVTRSEEARAGGDGLVSRAGEHAERRPAGGTGSVPPRRAPSHRPCALPLSPGGPAPWRLTGGEAQRLLCLTLKTRAYDDATCRRLAFLVGCERAWLEQRWHALRALGARARERRDRFRRQRDHAWFRMRCVETRLVEASTMEAHLLDEERARWATRYERARAALARCATAPTHAQIAEVLGLAKGTVDSNIFKARTEIADPDFRERLARLLEPTYG